MLSLLRGDASGKDPHKRLRQKLATQLQAQLYAYQMEGVLWMVQRESPLTDGRGGVLADGGKTGKKLQFIALTLAMRAAAPALATAQQRSALLRGGTLVVCSPAAMRNWIRQVNLHVKPGILHAGTWRGSSRKQQASRVSMLDLVLTDVTSLRSDFRKADDASVLRQLLWDRVVLCDIDKMTQSDAGSDAVFELTDRLRVRARWCIAASAPAPVISRLLAKLNIPQEPDGVLPPPVLQRSLATVIASGQLPGSVAAALCAEEEGDMTDTTTATATTLAPSLSFNFDLDGEDTDGATPVQKCDDVVVPLLFYSKIIEVEQNMAEERWYSQAGAVHAPFPVDSELSDLILRANGAPLPLPSSPPPAAAVRRHHKKEKRSDSSQAKLAAAEALGPQGNGNSRLECLLRLLETLRSGGSSSSDPTWSGRFMRVDGVNCFMDCQVEIETGLPRSPVTVLSTHREPLMEAGDLLEALGYEVSHCVWHGRCSPPTRASSRAAASEMGDATDDSSSASRPRSSPKRRMLVVLMHACAGRCDDEECGAGAQGAGAYLELSPVAAESRVFVMFDDCGVDLLAVATAAGVIANQFGNDAYCGYDSELFIFRLEPRDTPSFEGIFDLTPRVRQRGRASSATDGSLVGASAAAAAAAGGDCSSGSEDSDLDRTASEYATCSSAKSGWYWHLGPGVYGEDTPYARFLQSQPRN